jgi:predicted secreted hydrolase
MPRSIENVRVLAVLLSVGTLAVAAAAGTSTLHFPRDHYGHQAGIEWWYMSAYGHGAKGRRYSVFFTLFKRGSTLIPVSQVLNLDTGARLGHTEQLMTAKIGSAGLDLLRPTARLEYTPSTDTWLVAASDPGYSMRLTAKPLKPYVMHGGGTGVIRQGGAVSRYYSATRMSATGVIRSGSKLVNFTGTAWLDHQWGNFDAAESARHWDWFSCRFNDRTELMLYRFNDGHTSGTVVDRAGHGKLVTRFEVLSGTRVYRAAGNRWPLDWTVDVPAEHLTVRLQAMQPDQLFRGVLVPTFWEGAATATGTKHGICFVEETS